MLAPQICGGCDWQIKRPLRPHHWTREGLEVQAERSGRNMRRAEQWRSRGNKEWYDVAMYARKPDHAMPVKFL
jgi:hypothetical protein